jgi:putative DNA primase/helicase
LKLIGQPFKLTEPQDVQVLTAVVLAGAVVLIDTLNRAVPTAD